MRCLPILSPVGEANWRWACRWLFTGCYALVNCWQCKPRTLRFVPVSRWQFLICTKQKFPNAGALRKALPSQPHLVQQIAAWKSAVSSTAYLIPIPCHAFRSAFREALKFCGLPDTFKPYSLRRGGATHIFKMTGSYAQVCQAGRWASERTARIYISDSVAASVEITVELSSKAQRIRDLFWQQVLERRCYECA